jgi:hypothetical protein
MEPGAGAQINTRAFLQSVIIFLDLGVAIHLGPF